MSPDELTNWEKVKEYFETLPEEKRDNMFYKRAVAICAGKDDPLEPLKQGSSVSNSMAIRKAGEVFSGYNKPKRTPNHKTKSHVVVAKEGDKVKTIRFGQQGKTGDKTMTKRAKSFKARHAKNIAKGKMSAAYWANKVKW